MTYVEVAKSVVIPSADRVDEPRLVELSHQLSQALLRRTVSLTPTLVVDDLTWLASEPYWLVTVHTHVTIEV